MNSLIILADKGRALAAGGGLCSPQPQQHTPLGKCGQRWLVGMMGKQRYHTSIWSWELSSQPRSGSVAQTVQISCEYVLVAWSLRFCTLHVSIWQYFPALLVFTICCTEESDVLFLSRMFPFRLGLKIVMQFSCNRTQIPCKVLELGGFFIMLMSVWLGIRRDKQSKLCN